MAADDDPEIWAQVPGWPSYEVSNIGRVRNVRTGLIKKQKVRRDGHCDIQFWAKNKGHTRSVHRVVYEAFNGEIPPGMQVRHLNDIGTDNRLSNLAIGTDSDNKYDAVRNRRHGNARKTHCKRGHEFSDSNTRIRGNGQRICRRCQSEYMKEWWAMNPHKKKEYRANGK